jgi:hypothetical protein
MRAVSILPKVAILLSLVCAWTGRAEADEQAEVVGILSIETTGVSNVVAGQFEAEMEEALEGVGMEGMDREKLRERLADSDYLEGCTYGPCLAALREATKVPLVLVARIAGVGSNYTFVITLVDTKSGMYTSQIAQTCPVCTIEEAISTATLATISLLTGTGEAEVSEFSSDASSTIDLRSYRKSRPLKRSVRRTGLIFLGAGVVGGVLGGVLWKQERKRGAVISGSAGAAFITTGATMLLLSRRF